LAGLTVAAARAGARLAALFLGFGTLLPALHIVEQCMAAMAAIRQTAGRLQNGGW